MQNLAKKQQNITGVMKSGNEVLEEELAKVDEYYTQFYEIIDEHKRRVVSELKEEFENATKGVKDGRTNVDKALKDSQDMKNDILESMEVILN